MSTIDNTALQSSRALINSFRDSNFVDERGGDFTAAARQVAKSTLGVISAADLLTENTAGATQAVANQLSVTGKAGIPQLAFPAATVQAQKEELGTAGWEALLLATLKELGTKVSVTTEEELSALKATGQARADERRAAHDDYAAEVAKAEEAQKAMGLFSKILSIVLTVVGVLGAAFTGGASLLITVAITAVMAADQIREAATGKSFVADALAPAMKAIAPMIKKIANAVSGILQKFGVDARNAEIAANAIAMVATVLLLVAAALVVKGALPIGKVAGFVAKHLGKAIPNILKEMATKGSAQMAKLTAPFNAAMAKMGNPLVVGSRIQTGATVGGALNSGVDGASQILSAIVEADGKEIEAKFAEDPFIRDALTRAIGKSAESMSELMDLEAKVQEMLTNMIQSNASANLSIVRSMSM